MGRWRGAPSPAQVPAAALHGQAWLTYRHEGLDGEPQRAPVPWRGRKTDWRGFWERHATEYARLVLVPAPADWCFPAALAWNGAVNVDVMGIEHATMLRRWSGRWGARLLAMDDETMYLR